MTTCPGCGLVLPGNDAPDPAGLNASAACRGMYDEVAAFGLSRPDLGARCHQMTVDAYAAQHVGPSTKPITIAFALIGLELALERGVSGIGVRGAHKELADRRIAWPKFATPDERGGLTVVDVGLAGSAEEHERLVFAWGASTWAAWQPTHGRVRALVDEHMPESALRRLERRVGELDGERLAPDDDAADR